MLSTDRTIGPACFIGLMLALYQCALRRVVLKKPRVASGRSEKARTRVKSRIERTRGYVSPMKRIFDLTLAVIGLVLLFPFLLLVAVLIKARFTRSGSLSA